jgi:uroporphyrinogen decarboxylase
MNRLIQTLQGTVTQTKPIWLMRQAGRYLPEYRVMNHVPFMEKALDVDITTEITLQPMRRYALDAAIIFSDILMIPWAMGQDLEFVAQQGPDLSEFDLDEFFDYDPGEFHKKLLPVYRSIKMVRARLTDQQSLIGFVGAPHTLMHYMLNADSVTVREREDITQRLIVQTVEHLSRQIDAGCDVVQIFDSHAGTLKTAADVMRHCIEPNQQIVTALRMRHPTVPIICFPKGLIPNHVVQFCETVNPSAISIDYHMDPEWALMQLARWPIQGGMDPKKLLGDTDHMLTAAKKYLQIFQNHPYIFNLGHGVLKQTKPAQIQKLIDLVRAANI